MGLILSEGADVSTADGRLGRQLMKRQRRTLCFPAICREAWDVIRKPYILRYAFMIGAAICKRQ